MTPGAPPMAASSARRMIDEGMAHLRGMASDISRLLELQQGSRGGLGAAIGMGTVAGGGTVGVTSPTCTQAPPIGYGPGTIIPVNPRRRGLLIQNIGATGNLTLGLGIQSPTPNVGATLLPGGVFDGLISNELWPGFVTVVGSVAGVAFTWVESYGQTERGRNRTPAQG